MFLSFSRRRTAPQVPNGVDCRFDTAPRRRRRRIVRARASENVSKAQEVWTSGCGGNIFLKKPHGFLQSVPEGEMIGEESVTSIILANTIMGICGLKDRKI
ncbi:MAG: hypothetical protein K8F57_06790, partial [Alphaproteobacteria bacterium]|nr:hypothetical protein [Alphaproteobacteria bacterium]